MALIATLVAGCAGGALTTREKGAGIGALGGARRADSSAQRSVVRHRSSYRSALGLGAGALVGDSFGRENAAYEQDRQITKTSRSVAPAREIEELRRRPEY